MQTTMKTHNSVQLIGYLGKEPKMKTAVNGSLYARLSLATDFFRHKKDGTVIKKTTWHEVLAWDALAETIPGNFITGSHVLVQGEIRNRTYKDKEGIVRHITEFHATILLNLDR
jgi:single-strand DNA-binding protein